MSYLNSSVPEPSIIPKPIDIPTLDEQDQEYLKNNNYLKNESSFKYTGLPGLNNPGPNLQYRLKMAFKSGLSEEVDWAVDTCLQASVQQPGLLNLRANPWLIDELAANFSSSIFDPSETSNHNIERTLNVVVVLRNISQDTDNSSVVALNPRVKEILLLILENKIQLQVSMLDDLFEASKELLRYSVDLIETISSYISPAPKDDPMFLSLISILLKSTDRSLVITTLRSLSRLMVRSNLTKPFGADDITDEVLDTVSSYLMLTSTTAVRDSFNDDLILASVDFLYQYCLPGGIRVLNLLKNEKRALLIKSILPRLLTYGLDFQTEFTNELPMLKLNKRVRPPAPAHPPQLTADLYSAIDQLSEPARATVWMRCCYYAVEDGEVTQISLWRSYEKQFGDSSSKRLLPAVDFIKNVSNAFPSSSAVVIKLDNDQRKFIIKGIKPREYPVRVRVGEMEALRQPLPRESDKLANDNLEASQESITLFNYSSNVNISLTEINTSAALLLNCLTESETGGKLLEGSKELLLEKVLQVPSLLEHIQPSLMSL
ncbi:BA75_05069T0 [Komagataella pastoris]|uniref:BA75_05069T0 n=1 Tax=Komagataella pastoris TaxID=4922 RepID=A0A1B2JIW2_PICPA|nr:BA75_05069T0 [Komagataella pastoris]